MYVGSKAQKSDNKNLNPSRVWHGLGDVVQVPDGEALLLLQHPDIWMDVTVMKKDEVRTVIEARQEQFRQQQRRSMKADVRQVLGTLSDDELMAELERRTMTRGRAESADKPKPVTPRKPRPAPDSLSQEKDQVHRPEKFTDMAADVIGAIMSLDRETGLDSNGQPYPDKVREKIGYHVTDQEVFTVFSTMNAPK